MLNLTSVLPRPAKTFQNPKLRVRFRSRHPRLFTVQNRIRRHASARNKSNVVNFISHRETDARTNYTVLLQRPSNEHEQRRSAAGKRLRHTLGSRQGIPFRVTLSTLFVLSIDIYANVANISGQNTAGNDATGGKR